MGVNDYLVLAVVLSLVLGIIMALSSTSVVKESRAALGALALFALASPLLSLISSDIGMPNIDGNMQLPDYGDGYLEVVSSAYEEGLALAVAERLGIDAEDIEVSVSDVDIEKMLVTRIVLCLPSRAVLSDVRGLREWLGEEFTVNGGEVVIEYVK